MNNKVHTTRFSQCSFEELLNLISEIFHREIVREGIMMIKLAIFERAALIIKQNKHTK